MLIGLDIDGVLAQWRKSFVLWYNEEYGSSLTLESWNGGRDMQDVLGVSEVEAHSIMDAFSDNCIHLVEPIQKSQRFVKESNHDFIIVTRRPKRIQSQTKTWIETHYGPIDIHHTAHRDNGEIIRISKGDVCADIGVDVFVEDTPKHVEDVASRGIDVYMHLQPWNRHFKPTRAKCVDSLQDLRTHIDA